MSRDFLLTYDTAEAAQIAQTQLDVAIADDALLLFEFDNFRYDLFVMLTYSSHIDE